MAEEPTEHLPSEHMPTADGPSPAPAGGRPASSGALFIGAGLFAVVVGLFLRAAVGGQDRSDWNPAVKVVLQGLPILLIVGGTILLIWAAVQVSRNRSGAPRGDG